MFFTRIFKKLFGWIGNSIASLPMKNKLWIAGIFSALAVVASLLFGDAIIFTIAMLAFIPAATWTYIVCVAREQKTLPSWVAIWLLYSTPLAIASAYLIGQANEMIDGAVVVGFGIFSIIFGFSHFKKADELAEKLGSKAEKVANDLLDKDSSADGAPSMDAAAEELAS